MSAESDTPATKGDIARVETKLDSHIASSKSDIGRLDQGIAQLDGRVSRLDERVSKLDERVSQVDERLTRLATTVDKVAAAVVRGESRLDNFKADLQLGMRQLEKNVTEKLESFANRMGTLWRESATLPHVVDRQGKTLADHESRIAALESPTKN